MDIKSKKESMKETVSTSGYFTFSTPIVDGGMYSIVIDKQPIGQVCVFNKSVGLIEGHDVSDIEIDCKNLPPMDVTFEDNNFESDYARGNIHITRNPDESQVKSYVLSWGIGGGTLLGCIPIPLLKMGTITEIDKCGKDIDYYLNNTYLFCQMRRCIILECLDNDGNVVKRITTSSKNHGNGCGIVCQYKSHIDTVISKEESYMNWFSTESVKPRTIYYPEHLEDLVSIVKKAGIEKRRVRMAGSGLSISDITITEDILLRSRELEGLLNLESNQLKNTEDKY